MFFSPIFWGSWDPPFCIAPRSFDLTLSSQLEQLSQGKEMGSRDVLCFMLEKWKLMNQHAAFQKSRRSTKISKMADDIFEQQFFLSVKFLQFGQMNTFSPSFSFLFWFCFTRFYFLFYFEVMRSSGSGVQQCQWRNECCGISIERLGNFLPWKYNVATLFAVSCNSDEAENNRTAGVAEIIPRHLHLRTVGNCTRVPNRVTFS